MEKVQERQHAFLSCVVKKHWWTADPDVSRDETEPDTGRTTTTSFVGRPGGTFPLRTDRLGTPLCKASGVQPCPRTPHKPQERLLSKDVDNSPPFTGDKRARFQKQVKDYTGESVSGSPLTDAQSENGRGWRE